jgi:ATP-binding cassette subfamily B protein
MSKKDKKKKKQPARLDMPSLMRIYRTFRGDYVRHWKAIAVSYTGLLLLVGVTLLLPWPLKLILDHIVLGRSLPHGAAFLSRWAGSPEMLLGALVVSFIVLRLLESVFTLVHQVGLASVGEKMSAGIRERVFAHLQRLSLSFHDDQRAGDIMVRLVSDVSDLKAVLVEAPQNFGQRIVTAVAHVALMLVLDWRLALIGFSVIPILLVYNQYVGGKIKDAASKRRKKESDVASVAFENVTGAALVQAYGGEDLEQERFAKENRASLESGLQAMRLGKAFKRTSDIVCSLGTCAVIYFGGRFALHGDLSPGTVVLFAAYLRNLYEPIDKFAGMILDIAVAQASAQRLLELLDCDLVMADGPNARPAPPLGGRIQFENVTFAYKPGRDVIRDVSFAVEPGQKVALVGHNGAGKSTMVGLLVRFYDPQRGAIRLDGHDLRELTLRSVRDQVTILMQEATLLNQTVRENIAFGKHDATEEEVVQAARRAQAHDFIMEMPQGYDTLIAEGGENLSGGQRQRLNIARAIIRDTPIVVLDEPLTALDARTESIVRTALDELTRGRTSIVVAHRLDSVVHADRILMLEQGVLVASGTHGELMAGSERYRDLWSLQPAAPATDRSEPGNGAQPEPRAERPAVRKPLEAGGAA